MGMQSSSAVRSRHLDEQQPRPRRIVLVWSNPETPAAAPRFLARLRLVTSA